MKNFFFAMAALFMLYWVSTFFGYFGVIIMVLAVPSGLFSILMDINGQVEALKEKVKDLEAQLSGENGLPLENVTTASIETRTTYHEAQE